MKTIFLDTNVLLRADKLTMTIDETVEKLISLEREIVIHPMVEGEIINSLTAKGKLGLQANFAMQMMTNFTPFLDDNEYPGTDTALLVSAKRVDGIVFTLDKDLKNRCLQAGVVVISTHKKGKPQLFGGDFF